MKNILLSCLLLVCASSIAKANTLVLQSDDTIVPLVELYTSEGCSSCPPADKALSILAQNLNSTLRAAPLGFHVDYWDYLGWPDVHASPRYTQRQRDKAAKNQQNTIYTPEFFVAGREVRGGSGRIVEAILRANKTPAKVTFEATIVQIDEALEIAVQATNKSEQEGRLQVAIYENQIERHIKGGENRGKVIQYDNVVRALSDVHILPVADSSLTLTLALPKDMNPEHAQVVVFVEDDNLQTLQSARSSISSLLAP